MHTTGSDNGTHLYQSRIYVAGQGWGRLICGVAMLVGAFLYFRHMPSGSDGFQQTVAVLLTIIGVLAAVSGGINVRSGILTGPDGVTVRTGTGRRTYVRWADVQGFQLVPGRLSKRTVMVTVIRPGLPALSCRAASFSARDARAERTLDDLRAAFRNWSPGSAVTG